MFNNITCFVQVEAVGGIVYKVMMENMGLSMSLVTATPEMKCGGNLAHVVGKLDQFITSNY